MSSVFEYWGEVRKQRSDLLHLPLDKIQKAQIHRQTVVFYHIAHIDHIGYLAKGNNNLILS